jgi:hypothetical protein
LSEQIVSSTDVGAKALPYHLCFVKVNVTAGRQQIVAREQMALVRSMPNFAGKCFTNHTEDWKDIREATTEQRPVYLNSPGSQNDAFYRKITEEFRLKF